MDRIVSVSTLAFDGYPLETALDELAGLGVRYVEPAGAGPGSQQLAEEDFCPARANWLRSQLARRGLACLSLSAPMDLAGEGAVERFQRRLEFARNLGARCVSTMAGPAGRLAELRKNLPAVAERARDLGVVVALEGHGEPPARAEQTLELIRELDQPAVRAGYDTGEAWYCSRGAADPAEELSLLAPALAHVRLKSPKVADGLLSWGALGEGALDVPGVARVLRERLPGVPVSCELSPRQRSRDFEPRWLVPEIPPLEEIRKRIARSLELLEAQLGGR